MTTQGDLIAHPQWAQLMELAASDGMVTQPDRYGRRFVWGNGYFPQISGPVGVRGICDKPPMDINHPATKGVLLHMLREATGDQRAQTATRGNLFTGDIVWRCSAGSHLGVDGYPTEGEALAAALLAAWGEP